MKNTVFEKRLVDEDLWTDQLDGCWQHRLLMGVAICVNHWNDAFRNRDDPRTLLLLLQSRRHLMDIASTLSSKVSEEYKIRSFLSSLKVAFSHLSPSEPFCSNKHLSGGSSVKREPL